MTLPRLTHLQFAVLGLLFNEVRAGDSIRKDLRTIGVRQTGPAFYQMMARLEDAQWVEGWYEKNEVDGYIFQERRYRVTQAGRAVWDEARAFYAQAAQGVGAGEQ